MKRKVQKFLKMPAQQRLLFLEALLSVSVVRVGLLVLPVRAVRRALGWVFPPPAPMVERSRSSAEEIAHCVTAAARNSPVGYTCLGSALVGKALLSRHGLECHLRIGVRREGNRAFAAHAWLERDNRVIIGGPSAVVELYQELPDVDRLLAYRFTKT